VPAAEVKTALAQTWGATVPATALPTAGIIECAREKYSSDAWNLKF
jgi:hypothetical protein